MPRPDFVIRALDLKPGDRVLDLCCGTRAPRGAAGDRRAFAVTGLDMSEKYLDMAQFFRPQGGC